MTRPATLTGSRFDDYGLSAFTFHRASKSGVMDDLRDAAHHTHQELELHFVEHGAVSLDLNGQEERLKPGELIAFWGGMPHRDVDPEPPTTVYHVAQVPIVNVLSWIGSSVVVDRLLGGAVVKSRSAWPDSTADALAFVRWGSDLATQDARLRVAVEMEIHARLLRLVHRAEPVRPALSRIATGTADVVARAIQYVTRHFDEQLTVNDIALAVNRHHDHVMASFRQICGLTLWEYVTRLRLAEAQRLLATTDLPVLAVCHRSGFSSTSRMYEAFHRHIGQTPTAYRDKITK